MSTFFRAFWLVAGAVLACGQQPNTVTVNVSANQPVAAGTATFAVQYAETSLGSTVDSAVGAMGSAGLAATNLAGVSVSLSQGFIVTQYDFTLSVPASQFSSTRDKLITIQRNLANSSTQFVGWSTTYSASDEDTANALQLALPGLLAQARQRAGVLAAGMGMSLGPVQSVAAPAIARDSLMLSIGLAVTYQVQ